MTDQNQSRADALTPCVHADDPKACYRVRCQLGGKCVDDDMSPRQPAAAPIDVCPVCHAKPGQWQCPKSTNDLYNAPPDAACRALPTPSPADERAAWFSVIMNATASLEDAANWLTEPDSKRLTDGAAAFARKRANELWQARAASVSETGALGYAQRLATGLWEKHWRESAPQWKVLDDTLGVLTQIDNMVCGLSRSPAMAAEVAAIPEPTDDVLCQVGWETWNSRGAYVDRGTATARYRSVAAFVLERIGATQPAQADAREGLTEDAILDEYSKHVVVTHCNGVNVLSAMEPGGFVKAVRALLQGANQ